MSDKTVIRHASEIHLKLKDQYSAAGIGGAPYFAPDPVKLK